MSGGYAWYRVIVMVTAPCAVAVAGDCLYQFLTYFEKYESPKIVGITKPEIMWFKKFIPTFLTNLAISAWKKIAQEWQKSPAH